MKALTVYHPWAHLIAIGAKRFETRGQKTNHRGPLVIHAGLDTGAAKTLLPDPDAARPEWPAPFRRHLPDDWNKYYALVPGGRLVAVVEVMSCQPADDVARMLRRCAKDAATAKARQRSEEELAFGDFRAGRWALEMRVLARLDGTRLVRGQQGFWNLPPDIEAAVASQLQGAAGKGGAK